MTVQCEPVLIEDPIEPDTRAFLRALPPATGQRPSVAEARTRESQTQAIEIAKIRVDSEDGVIQSLG